AEVQIRLRSRDLMGTVLGHRHHGRVGAHAQPAPARGERRVRRAARRSPGVYTLLTIVVLISLFPLYWSFVGASRDNAAISKVPPTLVPGGNLLHAFTDFDMRLALFNSFTVSTIVTISVVLTSTMAGFAFAKLRFKGRGGLLIVVIATMMVP